jgi:AbrB family looped-hinge helix DNA binding protein
MSTTGIRDRRQITLPAEVSDAAGLEPGDQVEWRFEDGEIRGRKLVPQAERRIVVKLVRSGGALLADTSGLTIEAEAIAQAVREERESR